MAPKLLLLPGLDGTGMLFRPLLQALPPHIETIVIRYPEQRALGYDDLLPLVRDQLPRGAPFVLLGESFGGPLALRLAAESPAGLRGVVLAASFICCPYPWVPASLAGAVPAFPFRALPLWSRLKARLGGYPSEALAVLSERALASVAPEVFAKRVRDIVAVDAAPALQACKLPMLYLRGARDSIVPATNLRRIQRIQPGIEVVELPAGHMVLQDQPTLAAAAIASFLERHASH